MSTALGAPSTNENAATVTTATTDETADKGKEDILATEYVILVCRFSLLWS